MAPLHGLTVLDLTRVLSGPYCTMLLADLGARVVKVEQPGKGDDTRAWGPPFLEGESAYFLSVNRNKESLTLNFKHPDGLAVLHELIGKADVLVENFRPGTLTRLGLDYDSLATRYPRLIYCSISGFGHSGPRSAEAGYDAVMQAEGGLMSITGSNDGPPFRLGVAIADIVTGMFAAQGVTAALFARERSGRGQKVDIGMLDSTSALLTYQAGIFFATGSAPARMGNRHPTIVPYETFTASDGDFVIAVGNDDQWRRFCGVTGIDPEERFATNRQRVTNYNDLRPILVNRLRTETRAHWIAGLKKAGVPCGSVRDLGELFADPQIAARQMVAEVDHATIGALRVLGTPLKLSDTPASVRSAPPTLGQHTHGILTNDLGRSREDIAAMQSAGVILMEVSDVRKQVLAAIERAKRSAAEQRTRADEAEKNYPAFLSRIAVPVFRQVAGALKAEGYNFTVFTPTGGVRLMSDKNSEDFIELSLDTTGERPVVLGHVKRARGRRVLESERPIADSAISELTDGHVLEFLMREIEPFVER